MVNGVEEDAPAAAADGELLIMNEDEDDDDDKIGNGKVDEERNEDVPAVGDVVGTSMDTVPVLVPRNVVGSPFPLLTGEKSGLPMDGVVGEEPSDGEDNTARGAIPPAQLLGRWVGTTTGRVIFVEGEFGTKAAS